jgi:tRNA A-37 threonylcarbamoyl transferase component Bud32
MMDRLVADFLNTFARGERVLTLPAALPVVIDQVPHSLTLDTVLRLLPRKRVMLKGTFDDRNVAIKLFVKNVSSKRNIAREVAGYAAVHQARVATPDLLGHFFSSCGNFEGLIYQFIDDAVELGQCWAHFDNDEKKYWLRAVMNTSLALHCVGAAQEDIHLGNFLLQGTQLYLLDLGSIVVREAPLAQRDCLANLGQLIAQLDVREQPLADTALHSYFAQSGWIDSIPLRRDLHLALRRAWRRRLRDYLRKASRICSLTFFEHSWRRLLAHRRGWEGADMRQFLADPDGFMARGQLLKAGNTATVVKAEVNGRAVVIKRYNIKNWRHALARCLRPTRAMHSWLHAHLLEIIGIRSLVPVLLLEQRFGPLHGKAYFICEWIGAPDLLSHASDTPLDAPEVAALSSLLMQMQKCQLSHGDFKANNLLLDRGDIAVIDLDAMRRHRSARRFARAYNKDLERLRRNWPQGSVLQTQIATITQEVSAAS